jgi:hypothetical protein
VTEWCLVGTHHCWHIIWWVGFIYTMLVVLVIIMSCQAIRRFIK